MREIFINEPVRLPFLHCPKCGKLVDGASGISSIEDRDPMPKPGMLTICVYCSNLLVFVESITAASGLALMEATEEEKNWFNNHHVFGKVRQAITEFTNERKRPTG